ncbi:MAG: hypothetical protein JNJ89_15125, partial [Rubrivivax sp.]|nr:hypothetical protein [Rubrivivax sp.]
AGVTPELRSYGIPGAGDLWLPMVCTPGTNASAADQLARRHSPVTRLVRRFAKLLKSRGSVEADEQRLAEMAEVFRQEDGFARLLDAYGHELDVPPGPDPAEARVLFVIDQFEEVFHPTNKRVVGTAATRVQAATGTAGTAGSAVIEGADGRAAAATEGAVLVERLLDHFFRPHPRCYVVITMRSEHLNDCAAFLELPDAINKSSFLVRRLDTDELREAIVGPAQRFLRLMARLHAGTPAGEQLPAQVEFEPAVVDRLLRDVTAITQDPDHLPLLQHMLARLWQAALERDDAMDALVPARITRADLARAVNAAGDVDAAGIEQTLADSVNVLRESVHNWPERIWQGHGDVQQWQLAALFRRLALKDPNTGHYSQQRIEAGAAAQLLGLGQGPQALASLRLLLGDGFLGTVDYLFWDAEDPARITIKVSHESFIRGWKRFKGLIDEEAAHYDDFLALVRRCAAWAEHGRGTADLLSSGDLKRLKGSRLQRRQAVQEPLDDWLRLLAQDRDGARLVRHAAALPEFVEASRRVERVRNTWQRVLPVLMLLGVGLGMAMASLFTTLVQSPSMRRADLALDASSQASFTTVGSYYGSRAEALGELRRLLRAAADIDGARTGHGTHFGRASQALTDRLSWLEVVRRQGEFVEGVLAHSEPEVNLKLRDMLNASPLFEVPLPAGGGLVPDAIETECRSAATPKQVLRGRMIVAAASRELPEAQAPSGGLPGAASASSAGSAAGSRAAPGSAPPRAAGGPRRALFIPAGQAADGDLFVHIAGWDAARGTCVLGDYALVLKAVLASRAVIDAGLRFVVFSAESQQRGANSVIVQELTWRVAADGTPTPSQRTTFVSLADDSLLQQLRRATGSGRLQVVPTWNASGGRVLDVAGAGWRLVPPLARRLQGTVAEPDFRRAITAELGTPCQQLAANMEVGGWRMRMLDAGELCLAVYRKRSTQWATEQEQAAEVDELHLWVYPRPTPAMLARLDKRKLLPTGLMEPYARVSASLPEEPVWMLGVRGPYKGWLTLRTREAPGGLPGEAGGGTAAALPAGAVAGEAYIGAPLTTCALWRLAQPLVGAAAPAEPQAEACRESL